MRSLMIIIMMIGLMIPIVLKPHVGVLVWDWVSHMVPHKESYGRAYSMEFLDYVALLTVLGVALSKDKFRVPGHPILFAIGLYFVWVITTTVMSYSWEHSLTKLVHMLKVLAFAVLSIVVMRSPGRLKAFVLVMALSLAYYSVKGGLFTIVTGGQFRVSHGNGMFADNNHFAMAFSMVVPLAFYYLRHPPLPSLFFKVGIAGAGFLTIVSVLGTHSRGGLVALVAVLAAMSVFSKRRFGVLAVALTVALGSYFALPDVMASSKRRQPAAVPAAQIHADVTQKKSAVIPDGGFDFKALTAAHERALLETLLEAERYNGRAAARRAGLSYDQLRHLMKKHSVS